MLLEPVVGAVLAGLLLGEGLGPLQLLGGVLVLGGALVLQIRPPARPLAVAEAGAGPLV